MSRYKLINGDCVSVLGGVPDKSVDLIITDPPYLHVKGGMKSKKYNTGTWKSESKMNTKLSDFGEDKIFEFLDLAKTKLKKLNIYVFCSKLQLVYYFKWISQNKNCKYDLLVWDKVKYSMKSTKFFTSDIEYIIRIYESGVSLNKIMLEDGSKSDIRYYLKRKAFEQPRDKTKHETIKPLEMIEQFVLLSSNKNDIVLDCFMGSGTTGIASIKNDRRFIGIEIDKTYFDIAKNRLQDYENDLTEVA